MRNSRSNPKNDRLKRDYLVWLREAKQRSPATVDQVRHAIDRFEAYIQFKGFETFNREQAMGFKHVLMETDAVRSGKPMSLSTVHHILQANKDFLAWLHNRSGFRRAISLHDIAYLNLSRGEERQARTSKPKDYPSVEEFRRAIMAMPGASTLERRDRAVMALLLQTGIRDAALTGVKMRDVDIRRNFVFQDPRHAPTKFRKPIDSFLFSFGEDVDGIFLTGFDFCNPTENLARMIRSFPKP
jgi:site-specific recombinase XerC